jgi:hypothetical protein
MLVSALNLPPKGDQSWQEPDHEWRMKPITSIRGERRPGKREGAAVNEPITPAPSSLLSDDS